MKSVQLLKFHLISFYDVHYTESFMEVVKHTYAYHKYMYVYHKKITVYHNFAIGTVQYRIRVVILYEKRIMYVLEQLT